MRKFFCAAIVLAVSVGTLQAEEIKGKITKIGDKGVTFQKFVSYDKETKKATYEDAKDIAFATDAKSVKVVKVSKGKKGAAAKTEDLADGLSNTLFTKIDDAKGLRATLITNDAGQITEIRIGGGGKKGGKKKIAN